MSRCGRSVQNYQVYATPKEGNLRQIKSVNHERLIKNLQTWLKRLDENTEVDNKLEPSIWEWKLRVIDSAVVSASKGNTSPFGSVEQSRIVACIMVKSRLRALREKALRNTRIVMQYGK